MYEKDSCRTWILFFFWIKKEQEQKALGEQLPAARTRTFYLVQNSKNSCGKLGKTPLLGRDPFSLELTNMVTVTSRSAQHPRPTPVPCARSSVCVLLSDDTGLLLQTQYELMP